MVLNSFINQLNFLKVWQNNNSSNIKKKSCMKTMFSGQQKNWPCLHELCLISKNLVEWSVFVSVEDLGGPEKREKKINQGFQIFNSFLQLIFAPTFLYINKIINSFNRYYYFLVCGCVHQRKMFDNTTFLTEYENDLVHNSCYNSYASKTMVYYWYMIFISY